MRAYKCPSCGGNLELKYRFTKVVSCQYCGQTSYILNEELTAKGEKALLMDYGSAFTLGNRFTLNNIKYETAGRLRYNYPGGFWDEWLVVEQISSNLAWIHEDEGDLILYQPEDTNGLPQFKNIKPGDLFEINSRKIFITEKNIAQIAGGEGEIPFLVTPGEQANFIDGIVYGTGNAASFEFLPGKTEFNIGFPFDLSDIDFEQ